MSQKRGFILLCIFLMFSMFSFVSADMDKEMKKLSYVAEDYEIGNINFVQFLVKMSTVREKLNEEVSISGDDLHDTMRREQMASLLGKANERTKWVWSEQDEHDVRLEEYVPVWRKIVFDGNKIQIRLSAYPSVFRVLKEGEDAGERTEKQKFLEERYSNIGEEIENGVYLVYRLHFETDFKSSKDKVDFNEKIDEIKELAEDFNKNPTKSNANELAKISVGTEKLFRDFFKQNSVDCENVMKDLFGVENKRAEEKMLLWEVDFYEGDNFDVILNVEFCEDCDWNWINVHSWMEGRGPGFEEIKKDETDFVKDKYSDYKWEDFEKALTDLTNEYKKALESKDFDQAYSIQKQYFHLNDGWNRLANDLWQEVDDVFEEKREKMSEEEEREFHENYGWLKEEKERREMEKEIKEENYKKRKNFYNELFGVYDYKEFYSEQINYEKRLIEEFITMSNEICNNGKDDDDDGNIDCEDDSCGGHICGEELQTVTNGNETHEEMITLYCIEGSCQAKDEENEVGEVCGNNFCEEGEANSCPEDCAECPTYEAIECLGIVMFSGEDENGCSMDPICVEEDSNCEVNEDCPNTLCGVSECIEGTCKIINLQECKEAECVDGEKKSLNCEKGETIYESVCVNGLWKNTGLICVEEEKEEEEKKEEEEENKEVECVVKSDCGRENDVCSNSKCVEIPPVEKEKETIDLTEVVEEALNEEEIEEKDEEFEEEKLEEELVEMTGNIISNIVGYVVNNIEGEEETEEVEESILEKENEKIEEFQDDVVNEEEKDIIEDYDEEQERKDKEQKENDERRKEEKRHEEEMKERCKDDCNRMCYDSKIRPCVDECIREDCGEKFDCDVDDSRKTCEKTCAESEDKDSCVNECESKCVDGKDIWNEFRNNEKEKETWKMESGVFALGGSCRTMQNEIDGNIYFMGWGEPFEILEPIKQKYYTDGHKDWCKRDLENVIKSRQEFENGFDQDFAVWFFEKYLANSAEDWEQASSGIYEVYWNNVDNNRQMAYLMDCLNLDEMPYDYELKNMSYESEYGRIEYWEEVQTVEMKDIRGEVEVISPYMKLWIFPPVEFIEYEMKKSMEKGVFPGSPEDKAMRKNEDGLTDEEREKFKASEKVMKKIRKVTKEYGKNVDVNAQLLGKEGEIVFNLFVRINEEDILIIKPMLPEETPEVDITMTLDFETIYEMILLTEKDMKGYEIESPPWDKKARKGGNVIKNINNGVKMFWKIRNIVSSVEVYPKSAKSDVRSFVLTMLPLLSEEDEKGEIIEEEVEEKK